MPTLKDLSELLATNAVEMANMSSRLISQCSYLFNLVDQPNLKNCSRKYVIYDFFIDYQSKCVGKDRGELHHNL